MLDNRRRNHYSVSPMALRDCTLSRGSLYASWPAPLIQKLCRSYQAHDTTTFGGTLPAAFGWAMETEPGSFEAALRLIDTSAIKAVYDRMTLHSPLWAFVDLIYHSFRSAGPLYGFNFSVESPGRKYDLIRFLHSSPSFCRDSPVGQSMHQGNVSAPRAVLLPGYTCWREVIRGFPGLHVCLENGGGYHDCTIHVDPHQCVLIKSPDGFCVYDPASTARHLVDVFLPRFPAIKKIL